MVKYNVTGNEKIGGTVAKGWFAQAVDFLKENTK